MSEFPSPIPRTDRQSSAPTQTAAPYPPANSQQQQQHRSDRSQSADGRRLRGYLTAGAIRSSALRRDDDSASAQSHDRRRGFQSPSRSASRPRSMSRDQGREQPMFNRNLCRNKDTSWSRTPSRSSEPCSSRYSEGLPYERSERDNWRCTECNLWNAGDIGGCQKCHTPKRADGADNRGRRARSTSRNSRSAEVSYSRFSARSESHSPTRRLPVLHNLEVREWPPCFDIEGSAFVFDSRSGMFYESRSDFFYDPKSKLYYGNKKGAYFRHDDTTNPPFIVVHRMVPAAGTTESTPGDSSAPGEDATATAKAVIAIKLKTKKIKKPKGTTDAKVVHIVSKVHKEQVANIEKWSEKKAEIQADQPVLPSSTPKAPATTIVPRPSPAAADHAKVAKTAKGEPVCTICRRKFLTIDKLRLHEKVSELHKQNLAKLTTSKEKRELVPSVEYQDRAKKRRAMHGPELIMPPPRTAAASLEANASSAMEAQTAADNLGSNNIGNKLLHKLGWKSGFSLGLKVEDASGGSDGPTSALRRDQSNIDNLRKDWEMIETLVGNAGRARHPN